MSLARSQWVSLVAAAVPTAAAAALWTTRIIPDRSHWLAITATAISGLVWSIAVHVLLMERCHRETRQYVQALVDGLAETLTGRILDEVYSQIVDKITEQRDTADELAAARRTWRDLIDPNSAPVDLQQYRTGRAADASAHR